MLRNGLGNISRGCLLAIGSRSHYLKRFDPSTRSAASIAEEHRLIRFLVARDFPTPEVLDNADGQTITRLEGALYALYEGAPGENLYADDSVFAPFRRPEHAAGAGETLARFHRMAVSCPDPPAKPFQGLTARYSLLGEPDLRQALLQLLADHPPLRDFVLAQKELPELLKILEPYRRRVARVLPDLPRCVIHGDFIKRNLFFEGDRVVSVIDWDLCNRAPRLYDLCLALQPIAFPWDRLLGGEGAVNERDAGAFLRSYVANNPLTPQEITVLPAVLATCRLEFYLSLVGLELGRGNRDQAGRWFKLQTDVLWWFTAHPEAGRFLLDWLEQKADTL